MRGRIRVLFLCGVASSVGVAVACGSFDEEPAATPAADGGADGAISDGAPPPQGDASPDAPADAGGDACAAPCEATRVTTTNEDIRSLACNADPNGPIFVGTTARILEIDKTTFAQSVYANRTARHIHELGPTYSTGNDVLKGAAGTLVAAGQGNQARGVAVTPGRIFWARRDPFEIRTLPRVAGPDAGEVFAALPELPEGMLFRGLNVYVTIPSQNKIAVFAMDGGAPEQDILTGEGAWALANDGAHLYWVSPGSRAIRWVSWGTPTAVNDLFVSPPGTHLMQSICTDDTWVYFGWDREVHRVPVVP